ncbi:MAG: GGDEF domain-containing protein [Lysobacter sp.]
MWYRLRNDFPLSIIILMGACGTLGIFPFAIYRFISGDPLAGAVDIAIMLSIVGSATYAWRTSNTRLAAWFDVVLAMTGCVMVVLLLGRPALLWMYAGVLATFLLLRHGEALLVSAVALAVVAIHGGAFGSTLEMLMFLVTASMVALFAYIFAYRAEQLRSQLQVLASRDPLTGAGNRRSMEEELPVAIEMSRRERRPCGLAILDLDHFKQINDRYGHAVGDQVLVDFVRLCRSATRKVDRLFRYGGEEFVLLLPGADAAALRVTLDNLHSHLSASLQVRGEAVTTSIGAAALHPGERWETWFQRADAALYQAKHDGRNRTVVADGAAQIAALDSVDETEPLEV